LDRPLLDGDGEAPDVLCRAAAKDLRNQIERLDGYDTEREQQRQPEGPPAHTDEHGADQQHHVVGGVQLDLRQAVRLIAGRTEPQQHQREQRKRHRRRQ
jgi:hypothetical protein